MLGVAAVAAILLFVSKTSKADEVEEGDAAFDVDVNVNFQTDSTYLYSGDDVNFSSNGLTFLKNQEGFSATSYPDFKGRSIGYGHLIKEGESFVEPMSIDQATHILADDVNDAFVAVVDNIHVPITQNQLDALVSFAFNVGVGAFKNSTLLKKINAEDPTAANEFARWVYTTTNGTKTVSDALVSRRTDEAALYLA